MPGEIKLPEPAFRLTWSGYAAEYKVNRPNIGDTDCYTADQMRAAIEADRASRSPPTDEQVERAAFAAERAVYDMDGFEMTTDESHALVRAVIAALREGEGK